MVKILVNEQDYKNYINYKKEIKVKNFKKNKLNEFKYSEDDLKENFINTFEECYKIFNIYPSKKYFNKISNIDDSTYRSRLNMSWTKICEYYGYKIDTRTSFERIILESIKLLTGQNYISHKKFNWLKSIKNAYLYVDGVFEDIKLCVEADGKQHKVPMKKFGGYKAFEVLKANDEIKNNLIPKNGYKLIRIDIDEPWYDLNYLRDLLIKYNMPIFNS